MTRPIYWGVEFPGIDLLFNLLAILLGVILLWGFYCRYRLWRALGQADIRWDQPWTRLKRVGYELAGSRRILTHRYSGIAHTLILVGFILLFVGTTLVAIERDIAQKLFGIQPVAFLYGSFYQVFSFVLDLAGLVVIVGCGLGIYRRFFRKPAYLTGSNALGFWSVYLLIVCLTGFYVEAARISQSAFVVIGNDIVIASSTLEKWSSPVGYALSLILPHSLVSPSAQHVLVWWGHALLSFGFIMGLGYSIMRHVFVGVLDIYFANLGSTGTLKPIPDMENAEVFGVTTLDQFSWKTLFDSDVCVSCGRCEIHCPATQTGKPLSPKKIIQDIHNAWLPAAQKVVQEGNPGELNPLVPHLISPDELWSCTTCGACMQQCPFHIEHIPAIVDLRRAQVLMESQFPPEAQITLVNLENSGNPWAMDNSTRGDWGDDLEVPTLAEEPTPEVLFWVGCAGSFDVRSKPVSRAVVQILKAAGVRFAILGKEEHCCGDPARRIGNEYLYQSLAQPMVETMNQYGIQSIVTACPHCYHTIKNEYPQLGGEYHVYHHSEYIQNLMSTGRLHLSPKSSDPLSVTYHDSCYLGRHNQVYDSPRQIIHAAGLRLVEMPRNGKESFCCGAGGGRMWMEEHLGDTKINITRSAEALSLQVNQIAVACPFCKTMMTDGVKEQGRDEVPVRDIAEILADQLSR